MENKELIQILWNYMQMNHKLKKADCMIVLGTVDITVADFAADLFLKGYADKIIFSGGLGKITSKLWSEPEANIFAKRAIEKGVPEDKIYVENESTNTGDNFRFSKQLIERENLDVNSCIIVCKPYDEKRAWAAFRKLMPDYEGIIASNKISPEKYYEQSGNVVVAKDEWIHVLVGDIQRMKVFAEKGWQIEMDIPEYVWEAYEKLVKLGYDKYVIK